MSSQGTVLSPAAFPTQVAGKASDRRAGQWYARLALLVACVYFAQLYTSVRPSYLNLRAYAHGQERIPFQARELMRYPLLLAGHSSLLQRLTAGRTVVHTPELLALEIVSGVSLALAGWAAVKLFALFAPHSRLRLLPFALLIVLCFFDFYLAVPFSFPYDLPATLFLGWGAYFVYTRRFRWLLAVFLLGTWNRETTLFLILLLTANAAYKTGQFRLRSVARSELREIATLSAIWVAILLLVHHRYAANPTEAGQRISGNLRALLHPALWPSILSASAFLLPWIWLRRADLPLPLRAGVAVLPLWVLLLLCVGQILELRIYGDISVFVAVCAACLVSSDAATRTSPNSQERLA